MKLSQKKLIITVEKWIDNWNSHNLSAVMDLFHREAEFVSWSGQHFHNKRLIQRAWVSWFKNHGDFYFLLNGIFVDTSTQVVTIPWELTWPSQYPAFNNQKEIRVGVDVIKFKNGLIISKQSFCQTVIKIGEKVINLQP